MNIINNFLYENDRVKIKDTKSFRKYIKKMPRFKEYINKEGTIICLAEKSVLSIKLNSPIYRVEIDDYYGIWCFYKDWLEKI